MKINWKSWQYVQKSVWIQEFLHSTINILGFQKGKVHFWFWFWKGDSTTKRHDFYLIVTKFPGKGGGGWGSDPLNPLSGIVNENTVTPFFLNFELNIYIKKSVTHVCEK
jgi:hypothetical protein